ncbi:NADPH-dependent FMN reductase [Sphaerisporangium sp. NBC_01403]|uniref:NADPH-dependent FMN reductase n=2 Tax=Sphaerisporangium TaxID=321315 RepID=UPI0038686652
MKLAIITGSTRLGRKSEVVARWVHEIASKRGDADYEVVDIADFDLPHFDEALPPAAGQYGKAHTAAWAAKIGTFDGYVFVTPEYNHAPSGVLKNAIDFLYAEWNDKAAGFVGYGASGGTRAVEHLRMIMANLKIADVRGQVALSLFTDFTDMTAFTPAPHQEQAVNAMLDEVVSWSGALKTLRESSPDRAAA